MNIPTDLSANPGGGRRSAQLHQGGAVARRHPARRQRADQAVAVSARLRIARQERAGREPDAARAGGGQRRAPDADDQRRNPEHDQRACADAQTLRVGIPGDFAGARIPATLARFPQALARRRLQREQRRASSSMLRELKQGELDLGGWRCRSREPPIKPRHRGSIRPVWVRSEATRLDPHGPVPLVSFGEDCACLPGRGRRRSRQAGRECEFVSSPRGASSASAAAVAGLGVMVLPRSRGGQTSLIDLGRRAAAAAAADSTAACSCARATAVPEPLEELADDLAAALRPKPVNSTEGDLRRSRAMPAPIIRPQLSSVALARAAAGTRRRRCPRPWAWP